MASLCNPTATGMIKARGHISSAIGILTKATPIEARNTIGGLKYLYMFTRVASTLTVFAKRRWRCEYRTITNSEAGR